MILAVPTGWVAAHFEVYRKRAKWPFLWRITLEGLVMPFVLAAPFILAFDLPPRVVDLSDFRFWLTAIVLAPLVETVIYQTFPVMVARRLGARFWIQVVAGMGLFAAMHFLLGPASGLVAGVGGGFYFSFTYVHWRQESLPAALGMTMASHSLHNLAICLVGIAGEVVSS